MVMVCYGPLAWRVTFLPAYNRAMGVARSTTSPTMGMARTQTKPAVIIIVYHALEVSDDTD